MSKRKNERKPSEQRAQTQPFNWARPGFLLRTHTASIRDVYAAAVQGGDPDPTIWLFDLSDEYVRWFYQQLDPGQPAPAGAVVTTAMSAAHSRALLQLL